MPQRTDGFFIVPNEFIAHLGKLSLIELRVLLVYQKYAGSNREAYPAPATVATDIGLKDARDVRRAIVTLREKGFLKLVVQGGGRSDTNRYTVNLAPEETRGEIPLLNPEGTRGNSPRVSDINQREIATETRGSLLHKPGVNRHKNQGDFTPPSNTMSNTRENAAPAPHTPQAKTPDPERHPDTIWYTVADLWFGGTVAEPHRSHVGRLARDFRALHATAEEIRIRHARQKREWPKVEPTADSLIKHWHRFASAGAKFNAVKVTPEGYSNARIAQQIGDLSILIKTKPNDKRQPTWRQEVERLRGLTPAVAAAFSP